MEINEQIRQREITLTIDDQRNITSCLPFSIGGDTCEVPNVRNLGNLDFEAVRILVALKLVQFLVLEHGVVTFPGHGRFWCSDDLDQELSKVTLPDNDLFWNLDEFRCRWFFMNI